MNCSLVRVNATTGAVAGWLKLDSGLSEMQFPPRVDEDHDVLYVQDATSLRKLNPDLSEIWNVAIGVNCLYTQAGAYSSRFTPLLVNDSVKLVVSSSEISLVSQFKNSILFVILKNSFGISNLNLSGCDSNNGCNGICGGFISTGLIRKLTEFNLIFSTLISVFLMESGRRPFLSNML